MKAGTTLAKMITTPLSMRNRKRNILSSERGTRGMQGLLCRGLQIPLHLTLLTAHHTSTVNTSRSPLSVSACCYINEIRFPRTPRPHGLPTGSFCLQYLVLTQSLPPPISSTGSHSFKSKTKWNETRKLPTRGQTPSLNSETWPRKNSCKVPWKVDAGDGGSRHLCACRLRSRAPPTGGCGSPGDKPTIFSENGRVSGCWWLWDKRSPIWHFWIVSCKMGLNEEMSRHYVVAITLQSITMQL